MRRPIPILCLLLIATACGQTGPLYLPEEPPPDSDGAQKAAAGSDGPTDAVEEDDAVPDKAAAGSAAPAEDAQNTAAPEDTP